MTRATVNGSGPVVRAAVSGGLADWTRLAGSLLALALAVSGRAQGIPEPGLVMYGAVYSIQGDATQRLTSGTLECRIASPGGAVVVRRTQLQNLGDRYSYVLSIPFEGRIAGAALSPDTLELGVTPGTFQREFSVDGVHAAPRVTAQDQFSFGPADRAREERVDLEVTVEETYELWSMRWFGSVVPGTEDADGDGFSNNGEYVAGTDPTNAASRFDGIGIAPNPAGGIRIDWPSVAGRRYSVERSLALPGGFVLLQGDILATPTRNTFVDVTATELGPCFYRIGVRK